MGFAWFHHHGYSAVCCIASLGSYFTGAPSRITDKFLAALKVILPASILSNLHVHQLCGV